LFDWYLFFTVHILLGLPHPLYKDRLVIVKEGTPLQLACEYYGRPKVANVQWMRHNKPVNITSKTGLMMIDNVTANDGGSYRCVLKNYLGTADANISVVVSRGIDSRISVV